MTESGFYETTISTSTLRAYIEAAEALAAVKHPDPVVFSFEPRISYLPADPSPFLSALHRPAFLRFGPSDA